jgi:hypothetical protein
MIVHLLDGTYELFRHFYGIRRFKKTDPPFGAVSGVLSTVAQLIDDGATHVGVATDHIIESFRNKLWAGYKTGAGIEPALRAQFTPLEEALEAMGVAVWAMVELEADDALASAAHLAAQDDRVEKICIWTPDKDLAQCVVEERVVQVDRRGGAIRGAEEVRAKFGVKPTTWRWSAMPPMVIRASPVVGQRLPPRLLIVMDHSRNSLPRLSTMRIANWLCSSRTSRLYELTRRSSRMLTSFAGLGPNLSSFR